MKAIETKYMGPTNNHGSRVKATDNDRNSIVIGWNCELDSDGNHIAAAKALCAKMKWKGSLVMGGFPHSNVFVFEASSYGDAKKLYKTERIRV